MNLLIIFANMDRNRQIDVVGIINLTEDSYFSQSRCTSVGTALSLAGRHILEGASILDIGACSTRPGALTLGAEEEWRRLEPVLKAIRDAYPDVRISIDTVWASVVQKVYDLVGDFIVNDISAGEDDPEMLPAVGRLGLTYIAMHKRGNPVTMTDLTDYEDVVQDVHAYFEDFAVRAEAAGIKDWIVDPGFGFAKTIEQNYELMRSLDMFRNILGERRVLVGVSRKSMIYKYLGITPEDSLPATQVVHLKALENGADMLRVHDVAEAVRTVALYRMLS